MPHENRHSVGSGPSWKRDGPTDPEREIEGGSINRD